MTFAARAMKRASFMLAALLTLAVSAADAALTALVPADPAAVIAVDVRGMLRDYDVQKLVAAPAVAKLFAELEDAGFRAARVRKLAVIHWDDNWYAVLRSDDAPRFRQTLELRCAGKSPRIAAVTMQGRRVYRLLRPAKEGGRHRNKELCATFFGEDTVVVGRFVELEKFLAAPRPERNELKWLEAEGAELRCVYRRNGSPKPENGKNAVFDVKRATLEMRLSVDGARGISISGTAEFADPKGANTMRMTLPGILAFLSGLIFAEDPEAGDEFVRALRSRVSGSTLYFTLEMPEPLLERFLLAVESFFKEKTGGAAVAKTPGGR